ncbi:MAG: hypothetical protein J6O03_00865 [Butyrivibrio sp.]|nr:hypothetical protein [Butyrivibrio sp.]
MKANKIILVLFSSALIAFSAAFMPAPVAGVVRAEEATAIENTEDTQEENKEDEPELSEEEKAEKEAEAKRKALQNDPTHKHHFKWVAFMNESESAEGTIDYMCPECGKIWYFRPISAYYAFQGDVARRIEMAPENATVKVKTSVFINFNKQVMQALEERPDVSLYVSFLDGEYKGNRVSFVIPAGEDTVSLLDENGYAGFLFLGGKYGLTMEEPVVDEGAEEKASE